LPEERGLLVGAELDLPASIDRHLWSSPLSFSGTTEISPWLPGTRMCTRRVLVIPSRPGLYTREESAPAPHPTANQYRSAWYDALHAKEQPVTTRIDDLGKIPLFSRLSSVDLQFLATRIDEIEVPVGTALITEGMGNHAFYLLADGEVDVFVGGTHRRRLGPHDFFGEISMMVLEPATATVVTRTPVRAYV